MAVDTHTMLKHALAYLAQGRSVIPLHEAPNGRCTCDRHEWPRDSSAGKHPRIDNWREYQRRPPTQAEVTLWWTRWPSANIGGVMGRVSGLICVEPDNERDVEWVRMICKGDPHTETHRTHKGLHYVFRYPTAVEVPSCRIGPGVEVKSDGTQIVMPPSTHPSGHVYTSNGHAPGPIPDSLLQQILDRQRLANRLPPEERDAFLRGVPEGHRHNALVRLVGRWISLGTTQDEVRLLARAWNRNNQPPESDAEIIAQVDDLWRRYHADAADMEPKVIREGDDFLFVFPAGVSIALEDLRVTSSGAEANITIHAQDQTLWRRLNIASGSGRDDLRRALERAFGKAFPWERALETACQRTYHEVRAGAPLRALVPRPIPHTERKLMAPFIMPLGAPTILYGDSGVAKSTISLLVALSVATGHPLLPAFQPNRRARVAILDWESDEDDFAARMHEMVVAFRLDPDEISRWVLYKQMHGVPLYHQASSLRSQLARDDVGLVIVDSFFLAAGSEAEGSQASQAVFSALAAFKPITSLLISHVNSSDARQNDTEARPYGSIFNRAGPRAAWLAVRGFHDPDGPDQISVGLYLKKANRGRTNIAFGLTIRYENERIVGVEQIDLERDAELIQRLSLPQRIRLRLRHGDATTEELSAELGESHAVIKATAARMPDVVRRDGMGGKVILWGLRARVE